MTRMTPASAPEPYLKAENIYFVPVLRQRLTFAALVRQALTALETEKEWSRTEDLIAVALPNSVERPLRDAIDHLNERDQPLVSLIVAYVPGVGAREVFPVTPCDAMIEAARIACQREYPLEFVDLDISPANILRGPCIKDPNWADDTLINVIGIDKYIDLVQPYFSVAPARTEPLDTWREMFIAQRLRTLAPLWRRIIVVCDAGLVRSIQHYIRQPSLTLIPEATETQPIAWSFKIVQQLNLRTLLGYLDDYPRLVERYEDSRNWRSASDFRKDRELMDVVLEFAEGARDLGLSTRQHETFSNFLKNILKSQRRLCPMPATLYGAAASCYGRPFAERLYCYLAGYQSQIKAEQISSPGSTSVRVTVQDKPSLPKYLTRACNPVPPDYRETRVKRPNLKKKERN